MTAPELTGLFLGAGASCEVGLPLASELTEEIRNFLSPKRLQDLRGNAPQDIGPGFAEALDELELLLAVPGLSYEAILGALQTQLWRHRSANTVQYHRIRGWLSDVVYQLLHRHQARGLPFLSAQLRFLDGIKRLAEQNLPLWIFSLNHDVVVECFAARHGIPISPGFPHETTLPLRGPSGDKIGELKAQMITGEEIENGGLPFFRHGTYGINIFKAHGGLDIFTFHNGKDVLKISPLRQDADGMIGALRAANEQLRYVHPVYGKPRTRVIGEIEYADDAGECQLLRRTLLAGAFKYDRRSPQTWPLKMLDHFQWNIAYLSKLICIGYGFRDEHVNNIIKRWAELTESRKITIVSPEIKEVPHCLQHLPRQVRLASCAATDYLDQVAGITRSRRELLEKRFAALARRNAATAKHMPNSALVEIAQRIQASPASSLRGCIGAVS